MAQNTIIELLQQKGYSNTGDNRSYAIKSLNLLLDSGFMELRVIDYEEAKTKGYHWEKDGKRYRTSYLIILFGKKYFGHWMPTYRKTNMGGFIERCENDYKYLDTERILQRVATIICINKSGFDFLKNGSCNCTKCNGTGFIPQFSHYASGVCFDCGGSGVRNDVLRAHIKKNLKKVI